VALATVDNSAGNAGDTGITVARDGIFAFNMSGLVQADVGKQVWFSDDNTVTTTPGQVFAGVIVTIDSAGLCWVCIDDAVTKGNPTPLTVISASGAINPRTSGQYVITKAGVAAMTLAAPTSGTDDGIEIVITSSTLNAHTVTATGLLGTGAAATDVATFAARAGAGLTLVAYGGKWLVTSAVGITFS